MKKLLSSISLLVLAAANSLATTSFAQAAELKKSTFSLLYTFKGGNDGAEPLSGLISDQEGNLYGTTREGGADNLGTMYQLAPDGTETPRITFDSANGQSPGVGYLVEDKNGNFFGTTAAGGEDDYGAVYTLPADGPEQVRYSFAGGSDGRVLYYGLVEDKNGNLYGNAYLGGPNGAGEVYEVTPDGTKTALYAFCSQPDCTDGEDPYSQLIMDKHGNLYGTTDEGGTVGAGTVFELSPPAKGQSNWTETVLYSFQNNDSDGKVPYAGVIRDDSGNFYGTTYVGGTGSCSEGCGTVFKLASDGSETVLHSFTGGSDGMFPAAPVVEDKDGNLYGTATLGGAENDGIVFKIAPNGTETILYTFTGGSDGANPYSALHRKGSWLYGTASAGGADGDGTVFKVKD